MSTERPLEYFEARSKEEVARAEERVREFEAVLLDTDLTSQSREGRLNLARHIIIYDTHRLAVLLVWNTNQETSTMLSSWIERNYQTILESAQGNQRDLKSLLRARATDVMVEATSELEHGNPNEVANLQKLSKQYDKLASSIPDYAS